MKIGYQVKQIYPVEYRKGDIRRSVAIEHYRADCAFLMKCIRTIRETERRSGFLSGVDRERLMLYLHQLVVVKQRFTGQLAEIAADDTAKKWLLKNHHPS